MNTYVLYHANCYDGFGAAFAAWLNFGHGADYISVSYGNPPPTMEPGSNVYIVDFSYPAATLLALAREHAQVVVLDHHASAQKDLVPATFLDLFAIPQTSLMLTDESNDGFLTVIGKLKIKFDMNHSGAVLAWHYWHPDFMLPKFFAYLQDRDLWKFDLPQSQEVSCALRSYPMAFAVWKQFLERDPDCNRLQTEGEACLRLTNQQVEIMADNARMAVFNLNDTPQIIFNANLSAACGNTENCYEVPVANTTVFFSEVGNRLLEMYPEASFAAYYLDRKDGKRQWGLRSRPDFDCSIVAKAFSGGGHKQAAGFVQQL